MLNRLILVVLVVLAGLETASAQIVAIGANNTAGKA